MNEPAKFKDFKRYFTEYQKRFGLTGYKVYFKYEPIEYFADITINPLDMVATVRLDSSGRPEENTRRSAKHEALHLLLSRLECLSRERWVSEKEIDMATEELVHRLEDLIED